MMNIGEAAAALVGNDRSVKRRPNHGKAFGGPTASGVAKGPPRVPGRLCRPHPLAPGGGNA